MNIFQRKCASVTTALVCAAGLIRVKQWVNAASKHELLSASLLPPSPHSGVVYVIVISIVGKDHYAWYVLSTHLCMYSAIAFSM